VDKKTLIALIIVGILVLGGVVSYFIFSNKENPSNLSPPAITGNVVYSSLSYSQLRSGVSLTSGWNTLYWPSDAPQVSVSNGLQSISNYYYAYDYSARKYNFNPTGVYASYNNKHFFRTRLFSVLRPGIQYGIYMPSNGVLRYSPSSNMTNGTIIAGNFTYPNGTIVPILNTTIIFPNITTGNVTIVIPNQNSTTIILPNQSVIPITNTTIVTPNGTIINTNYTSNMTNSSY